MKKLYKQLLIIFILIPIQISFKNFGLSILHNDINDAEPVDEPNSKIVENIVKEAKIQQDQSSDQNNDKSIVKEEEKVLNIQSAPSKHDVSRNNDEEFSGSDIKIEGLKDDETIIQNERKISEEEGKEVEMKTDNLKEKEISDNIKKAEVVNETTNQTKESIFNSNDTKEVLSNDTKTQKINLSKDESLKTNSVPVLKKKTKPEIESFEEWKDTKLKEKAKIIAVNQQQKVNSVSTVGEKSDGDGNKAQVNPQNDNEDDENTVVEQKKNFADPDCGAKLIGHNPESNNPYHILSESKDDYMLNSCKNRVWFAVELCEPIKITKFELANLELFSNVPRLFRVYASERFIQTSNSKDWPSKHLIGTFEANNVRTIQTFSIRDTINPSNDTQNTNDSDKTISPAALNYAKYVRFEMISHYGNQHYCPLSLLRIYGKTVSDESDEVMQNEDEDLTIISKKEEIVINNIETSTESVPFNTKSVQHFVKTKSLISELSTSFYNNLISVISHKFFNRNKIFDDPDNKNLVETSTKSALDISINKNMNSNLDTLLIDMYRIFCSCHKFVHNQFSDCCQCLTKFNKKSRTFQMDHTFNWLIDKCGYFFLMSTRNNDLLNNYLKNMKNSSSNETIENDQNDRSYLKVSLNKINYLIDNSWLSNQIESLNILQNIVNNTDEEESNESEIPNPKENSDKGPLNLSQSADEALNMPSLETVSDSIEKKDPGSFQSTINNNESTNSDDKVATNTEEELKDDLSKEPSPSSETEDIPLTESTTTGNSAISQEQSQTTEAPSTTTQPTPVQKETISIYGKDTLFMRLSNRIKILELNMSLSSQYLEKLSQHYRIQMEEMERTFNFTTTALKEATRVSDERDHKQHERIIMLERRLESLQKLVNSYEASFENIKFQADIQALTVTIIIIMVTVIETVKHLFSKKRHSLKKKTVHYDLLDFSQLTQKQLESIIEKKLNDLVTEEQRVKMRDLKNESNRLESLNSHDSKTDEHSKEEEEIQTLVPKLTESKAILSSLHDKIQII